MKKACDKHHTTVSPYRMGRFSKPTRLIRNCDAKFKFKTKLFGRLGKRGRAFLIEQGWTQFDLLPRTSPRKLAFVWPRKSGPQVEVNNLPIPQICLPPASNHVTDLLNNKPAYLSYIEGYYCWYFLAATVTPDSAKRKDFILLCQT